MVFPMATVNFSVPDEIKDAFNEAFKGKNKSAVIAALMQDAVEQKRRRELTHAAVKRILDRRASAPRVASGEIETARRKGRP